MPVRTLAVFAIVLVQSLPGVGGTLIDREIRVTLLSASRLDETEYRREMAPQPANWAGGGFHFVFAVENRPGAPTGPVLGDIRVFVDGRQYNSVSNAASSKPFAPLVVIRDKEDALARDPRLKAHMVVPHASAVDALLDIYVPGGAVSAAAGEVTLEQCETHRRSSDRGLVQLTGMEMRTACVDFRFAFSTRQ